MDFFITMLLENYVTICLAFGFGIIVLTNHNFSKKINNSFIAFILVVLVILIVEMLDRYYSTLPYVSTVRYFASSIGYILRPSLLAILINVFSRRKKSSVLLWLPIVFLAIIAISTPYTHWMYFYSDTNAFVRGPLTYIPHIISLLYANVFLYLIVRNYKYISLTELFVVTFSLSICALSTAVETVSTGIHNLMTGSMIVSCVLYYIVLYVDTFKIDSLTGLLNRRSLYEYINSRRGKEFAVISVDLNGLKAINDSYGHSAGDEALKTLANGLVSKADKKYRAYRTGGDEFIECVKNLV